MSHRAIFSCGLQSEGSALQQAPDHELSQLSDIWLRAGAAVPRQKTSCQEQGRTHYMPVSCTKENTDNSHKQKAECLELFA